MGCYLAGTAPSGTTDRAGAVGMGVMALLIWIRHHLWWWPFHPIGYLVSGTWILNSVWCSIFLVLTVKATVLKVAGPSS